MGLNRSVLEIRNDPMDNCKICSVKGTVAIIKKDLLDEKECPANVCEKCLTEINIVKEKIN
jgi:hypothetical protein